MKQKIRSFLLAVCLFTAALLLCSCSLSDTEASFVGEGIHNIHVDVNYPAGSSEIKAWGDGKSLYYYFLPSGTGPDDLTVETENGITIRTQNQEDVDRTTYLSGDSLRSLKTDTVYLLGCYDENHYLYEFPVIFKSSANLHSIFITTDTGDISPILYDKDHKIPGTMVIINPQGQLSYQGKLDYIKGRGNGSWFSFKKPFNIKLADGADLLGMGKARKYCLLSQESDRSHIRNKIGFSIAEAVEIPYAPDAEFADLWIDGVYQGLYLLTDRVNISEGSVDIRNLQDDTQALNSHKLSSYPVVDIPGMRYSDIPVNPTDITGGYLMEVDKFYHEDKAAWFNTYYLHSVTLKSPSYCSKMQMDYIHLLMQEIESMFFFHTEDTLYREYIDEDSWVKMGLLQEIIANTDFMGSSQYFYKEPDVNGKRSLVYAGPVWDLDQSMAPRTGSYLPSNSLLMPAQIWYMQLLDNPNFTEALRRSYGEHFRPIVDELLDHGIDDMAETIKALCGHELHPLAGSAGCG